MSPFSFWNSSCNWTPANPAHARMFIGRTRAGPLCSFTAHAMQHARDWISFQQTAINVASGAAHSTHVIKKKIDNYQCSQRSSSCGARRRRSSRGGGGRRQRVPAQCSLAAWRSTGSSRQHSRHGGGALRETLARGVAERREVTSPGRTAPVPHRRREQNGREAPQGRRGGGGRRGGSGPWDATPPSVPRRWAQY